MKKADRLLIQVRRASGDYSKQVYLGFVDLMEDGEYKGKYRSRADLWDGKQGSKKPEDSVYSYHDTVEDAVKAIEAVAEVHRPPASYKTITEDVPIIICDWGDIDKYAC